MGKKYSVVKDYIMSSIVRGELKPGDRIPSENELVQTLNMSRNPVRRALSELAHDGVIFTIHGSGSYVKRFRPADLVNIYCLLDIEDRRFEGDLIQGMRAAAADHPSMNLHIILKKPGRDTRELIEVLKTIDTSVPGGLVFLPVLSEERSMNRMLGAALRSLSTPHFIVVQLDRYVPEYEGACVMTDHRLGSRRMVEYLLDQGHREIAVLYEHPENTSVALRFQGLQELSGAVGFELPPRRRILMPYTQVRDHGEALLRDLIGDGVTCLFCFENAIAREIWRLTGCLGIKIPDQLSLCAFDDHSFRDEEKGFITCVSQQLDRIGRLGIEVVLRSLGASRVLPERILLEPAITVRTSVAPR